MIRDHRKYVRTRTVRNRKQRLSDDLEAVWEIWGRYRLLYEGGHATIRGPPIVQRALLGSTPSLVSTLAVGSQMCLVYTNPGSTCDALRSEGTISEFMPRSRIPPPLLLFPIRARMPTLFQALTEFQALPSTTQMP